MDAIVYIVIIAYSFIFGWAFGYLIAMHDAWKALEDISKND